MRVKAASADLHLQAAPAGVRQRLDSHLPGHGRRVAERGVEAVRHDIKAGVRGAGIGRAERVKLLDGAIGVHHDQRARQQPESFHFAGVPEDELDQLAE
jgi:hypothetical protein